MNVKLLDLLFVTNSTPKPAIARYQFFFSPKNENINVLITYTVPSYTIRNGSVPKLDFRICNSGHNFQSLGSE